MVPWYHQGSSSSNIYFLSFIIEPSIARCCQNIEHKTGMGKDLPIYNIWTKWKDINSRPHLIKITAVASPCPNYLAPSRSLKPTPHLHPSLIPAQYKSHIEPFLRAPGQFDSSTFRRGSAGPRNASAAYSIPDLVSTVINYFVFFF